MSGRGRGRARGTGGTRVARGGGRGRGSAGPSAAGTGTRPPPWQLKTVLCDFHERGSCARGETCWFAHGSHQLQRPRFLESQTSMLARDPDAVGLGLVKRLFSILQQLANEVAMGGGTFPSAERARAARDILASAPLLDAQRLTSPGSFVISQSTAAALQQVVALATDIWSVASRGASPATTPPQPPSLLQHGQQGHSPGTPPPLPVLPGQHPPSAPTPPLLPGMAEQASPGWRACRQQRLRRPPILHRKLSACSRAPSARLPAAMCPCSGSFSGRPGRASSKMTRCPLSSGRRQWTACLQMRCRCSQSAFRAGTGRHWSMTKQTRL